VQNLNKAGEVAANTGKEKAGLDEKFLSIAFALDLDLTSELFTVGNGEKYFVLKVDEVTPPKIRALDEVKQLVIDAWRKEKRAELAKQVANNLLLELNKLAEKNTDVGASAQTTAKQIATLGLKLGNTEKVVRNDNILSNLGKDLVDEVFKLNIGNFSKITKNKNGDLIIARLDKIISANENEESKKTLNEAISTQIGNEIIEQYLTSLRKKYKVKYNL
jgi:peptidyl-prolyl cis-trans isomerase D